MLPEITVRAINASACTLTWTITALTLLGAGSTRVHAQTVTLTARPDSSWFAPGDSTSAWLVVESNSAVDHLRLSWLHAEGFLLRTVTAFPDQLAASTPRVIELRIAALADALPRTVELRLDYCANGRAGVAFRAMRLVADPLASAAQAVEVRVVPGLGRLTSDTPDHLHLLVTNKTTARLRLRRVAAASRYLQVEEIRDTTLPPLSVTHLELPARANKRVRPGKYPMILDLDLAWSAVTAPRSGHLVLDQDVEVGITGVSDILTALAVPSFFLLPGALMLATFGMLWSTGLWRSGATGAYPLKKSEPEFWVVAVSLSLVVAWVYQALFRVNYLDSYSASDVARIWFGSIVTAALVYLIWHGALRRYLKHKYPWPGAPEIEVIRRLPRMGLLLDLPGVRHVVPGGYRDLWLLAPTLKATGVAFVVPTIEVDENGLDADGQQGLDRLLGEAVKDKQALEKLIEKLEPMSTKLSWTQQGQWPAIVDVSTLQVTGNGRLVEPK